jgi:glutathione S-transferase
LGKNINKFYETALAGHAPKFLKWLSVPFVYPQVWDKLNFEGTGLHSDNEVETILRADLKALNALLGEKYWLVGDQPTLVGQGFSHQ